MANPATVAKFAEAEQLREEILNDRQQILDYEKRREQNEGIIKEVKASRGRKGAQDKTYILMGDLFVRQTNEATEMLLQAKLVHEVESLRAEINSKNTRLNLLQGNPTQTKEAAQQD